MNRFCENVAMVLEVPDVNASTRFREVSAWDSLKAFGLLVMMENDWHAPMNLGALRGVETVGELQLEAFLNFAAQILNVSRTSLSASTEYGSIPEWDSVAHLRLCMETEARFGISYSIERIPAIRKLADFMEV